MWAARTKRVWDRVLTLILDNDAALPWRRGMWQLSLLFPQIKRQAAWGQADALITRDKGGEGGAWMMVVVRVFMWGSLSVCVCGGKGSRGVERWLYKHGKLCLFLTVGFKTVKLITLNIYLSLPKHTHTHTSAKNTQWRIYSIQHM